MTVEDSVREHYRNHLYRAAACFVHCVSGADDSDFAHLQSEESYP